MVDDKVQLVIKDHRCEFKPFPRRSHAEGTYSFTAALPTRKVTVDFNKQKGPEASGFCSSRQETHDFTHHHRNLDEGGGAKEYQLEIFWAKRLTE